MESSTVAVIFLAVWVGILAIYCIFRLFGGRLVDILACDFCRGPLCDCWGAGGQIDQRDKEYPFVDGGGYPHHRPTPQLPPIVIVNKTTEGGGGGDRGQQQRRAADRIEYTNVERGSSDDDYYYDEEESDGGGKSPPPKTQQQQQPSSLLLTSRTLGRAARSGAGRVAPPSEANAPVVV